MLAGLLEVAVVVTGQITHIVLHTDTVVVAAGSVGFVNLHTTEDVDNVHVVIKGITIICSKTQAEVVHSVLPFIVETAVGQYSDRQRIGIVGVSVEPWVGITHGSIIHHTERHGHVRVFPNLGRLIGARVFVGGQCPQFNLTDGLILQFTLNLHIEDIQIDVVVGQLIVDVEWSKVANIVGIGVQRTRCVQGVAVGVDVKVAAGFAGHSIVTLVS